MGCCKICFIIGGVLSIGMAYLLYKPLPDELEQKWEFQLMYLSLQSRFIWSELLYRLGLEGDRWPFIRKTIKAAMTFPVDVTGLEVSNSQIDGVDVRIYKPKVLTGLVPGLVYLHGGSWSMLDSEIYDNPLSNISRELQTVVIGVDYRLAPEFPFPYPYDDCLAVTKFVLKNAEVFGIDSMRVGIGGDSAGGNIAASIVYTLRNEQHQPALKAHVSIYSVLQVCDFTLPGFQTRAKYEKSFKTQALYLTGLYLNLTDSQLDLFMYGDFSTPELKTLCQKYVDINYLPSKLMFEGYERGDHVAKEVTDDVKTISKIVSNPLISPLLVEDLSGMPTTLVLSVAWDILADENQIYAGRLKAAGVKVTSVHMRESFHGCFNLYPHGFKSGVRALNIVKNFLKDTL